MHECARRCAAGVEWVLNRENSPSSHHARTIRGSKLPTSVHAEIISLTRNDSRVYATRAQMCPQVCGWRRMGPKSRELAKFSQCTNHSRQRAAHLLAVHVAIIAPPATTVGCMSLVHECVRRCAAGVEWVLNRENSPSSHNARTIRGSELPTSSPFMSPSSHHSRRQLGGCHSCTNVPAGVRLASNGF